MCTTGDWQDAGHGMNVLVSPETEYSSRLTGHQRTGLLGETIAAEFARTRKWKNIDRNVAGTVR